MGRSIKPSAHFYFSMQITGTHFNYYHVCHRKLWLFASGIGMEQTSDLVYEGKLIHDTSYRQRAERYEEVAIDGIKIDYYDARNKVVHEIKKSDRIADAHRLQLLYYLYVLERNGVEGVMGILEYPRLRKREEVYLNDFERERIRHITLDIMRIISDEVCPPLISSGICKNCSYCDFCFAGDVL